MGEDGKKVKAESSKTQRTGTVKGVGVAVQTDAKTRGNPQGIE